jgi:hypothetical protein
VVYLDGDVEQYGHHAEAHDQDREVGVAAVLPPTLLFSPFWVGYVCVVYLDGDVEQCGHHAEAHDQLCKAGVAAVLSPTLPCHWFGWWWCVWCTLTVTSSNMATMPRLMTSTAKSGWLRSYLLLFHVIVLGGVCVCGVP